MRIRDRAVRYNDTFGDSIAGQPCNIVDGKLVHKPLAVFLDGFDADAEFGGDLFVGESFGNQLQDFGFPGSQFDVFLDGLPVGKGFAALIAQSLGNRGAEKGVAPLNFPNGFDQFIGGSLLHQVAEHAGRQQIGNNSRS